MAFPYVFQSSGFLSTPFPLSAFLHSIPFRRPLKLTSAFESFLPWLVMEFDPLPPPDHENHDVRLPKIDEGLAGRRVSDEAKDELRMRVVSGDVDVTVKPLLADGFWFRISVD